MLNLKKIFRDNVSKLQSTEDKVLRLVEGKVRIGGKAKIVEMEGRGAEGWKGGIKFGPLGKS